MKKILLLGIALLFLGGCSGTVYAQFNTSDTPPTSSSTGDVAYISILGGIMNTNYSRLLDLYNGGGFAPPVYNMSSNIGFQLFYIPRSRKYSIGWQLAAGQTETAENDFYKVYQTHLSFDLRYCRNLFPNQPKLFIGPLLGLGVYGGSMNTKLTQANSFTYLSQDAIVSSQLSYTRAMGTIGAKASYNVTPKLAIGIETGIFGTIRSKGFYIGSDRVTGSPRYSPQGTFTNLSITFRIK